jgi:beta-lactam-binding protein with PASTA domain
VSIVSRGLGTDGNNSTILLRGFAQSLVSTPFSESIVSLGFGTDSTPASILRRGLSCYTGLPAVPTVGSQYKDVTALPALGVISVLQGESPASVGDVMIDDVNTSRQGYGLMLNGDGTFSINAGGDKTVEFFSANIFHVGSLSYDGTYTVFVNDPGPSQVSTIPNISSPLGVFISLDFVADGYVVDPIGAGLIGTVISGALPSGVTLVGSLLSGFAQTTINNTLSVRLTDVAGESLTVSFLIVVIGQVTVPNLYDLTGAAASSALSALGLVPVFSIQPAYDNTVPFGSILSQQPVAGFMVSQGTQVILQTSLGSTVEVFVPSVIGLTYAAALAALNTAGFTQISSIFVFSVAFAPGFVAIQTPAAGSAVPLSTSFLLSIVSTALYMPNVVGLEYAEAVLVLQQTGILVPSQLGYFSTYPISIIWQQSSEPPGTVLAQSIPVSQPTTVNVPIVLTVSEFPVSVASP